MFMDRDEPFKEREYYLTVLAIDNGSPQLEDWCTFKVTIRDINDNEPVFDKVVGGSAELSSDLSTGSNAQESIRPDDRGSHLQKKPSARVPDTRPTLCIHSNYEVLEP